MAASGKHHTGALERPHFACSHAACYHAGRATRSAGQTDRSGPGISQDRPGQNGQRHGVIEQPSSTRNNRAAHGNANGLAGSAINWRRRRGSHVPRARNEGTAAMSTVVTMKQLLESGVHFGHQTRRWNPKMKRYIFTERNGIYIIDLQQSLAYIDRAYEFIRETVAHGVTILYAGTKKQAQEAIAEQARRVG